MTSSMQAQDDGLSEKALRLWQRGDYDSGGLPVVGVHLFSSLGFLFHTFHPEAPIAIFFVRFLYAQFFKGTPYREN